VVQYEYFRRFVERRVAPGEVSDQIVKRLIAAVNDTDPVEAREVLATAFVTPRPYAVLDSLVVLADLFDATHRQAVIEAVSRASLNLGSRDSAFIPSERERATSLVYRLLELGRDDTEWQRDAMAAAIHESSSLEFARELVGLATPEKNGILTAFEAFEPTQLAGVLAAEVRDRLAKGLDPFTAEPRYAPYILASLGDPKLASAHAIRLGQVIAVLRGYASPEGLPWRESRLQWDTLCRDFDVDGLRSNVIAGDPLSDELISNPTPCGHASE
jgi:hypothetical protein